MLEGLAYGIFELSENTLFNGQLKFISEAVWLLVTVFIKKEYVLGVQRLMGLEENAFLLERKHLIEIFHWHFFRSDSTTKLRCI